MPRFSWCSREDGGNPPNGSYETLITAAGKYCLLALPLAVHLTLGCLLRARAFCLILLPRPLSSRHANESYCCVLSGPFLATPIRCLSVLDCCTSYIIASRCLPFSPCVRLCVHACVACCCARCRSGSAAAASQCACVHSQPLTLLLALHLPSCRRTGRAVPHIMHPFCAVDVAAAQAAVNSFFSPLLPALFLTLPILQPLVDLSLDLS